jgi:hypothetical protein
VQHASVADLSAVAGRSAARPAAPAPRAAKKGASAAPKVAAPAAKKGGAKASSKKRARGAGRRPSDEIQALQAKVVDFVNGTSGGVAISDIASKLGVDKGDLPRPLALAVAAGAIKKTGEKRLTRYFPGKGGKKG